MQVVDKEMYHFHNNKLYNEIWVPNNQIIIDNNFEAAYSSILKVFDTSFFIDKVNKDSFDAIIDYYLKEEQSKETNIKLLVDAKFLIFKMNIFKREKALEEIRQKYHPDLPSRIHSIWLCDEKQIEFWRDQLSGKKHAELNLYKVLISGNLFKSSDVFIPNDNSSYEENLKEAKKYWNPKFETEAQEQKAEYLFQGKVKILEKVER